MDTITSVIRIQRKRTKGFKLPENTICVNRPTKWGNPFRLKKNGGIEYFNHKGELRTWTDNISDINHVIKLYKSWITNEIPEAFYSLPEPPTKEEIKDKLKDKNLACFCSLQSPCHADVLLKLANL